jgi:hypothetical protein
VIVLRYVLLRPMRKKKTDGRIRRTKVTRDARGSGGQWLRTDRISSHTGNAGGPEFISNEVNVIELREHSICGAGIEDTNRGPFLRPRRVAVEE